MTFANVADADRRLRDIIASSIALRNIQNSTIRLTLNFFATSAIHPAWSTDMNTGVTSSPDRKPATVRRLSNGGTTSR